MDSTEATVARTQAMVDEAAAYTGPDQEDALWGELDCRVELMILDEVRPGRDGTSAARDKTAKTEVVLDANTQTN